MYYLLLHIIVDLWLTVEPETSIVGIIIIKVEVLSKWRSKHCILGDSVKKPANLFFLMPLFLFFFDIPAPAEAAGPVGPWPYHFLGR